MREWAEPLYLRSLYFIIYMKNTIIISFCALLLPFFLASCKRDVATYSLEELTDSTSIQLNRWTVLGVLSAKDTLQERFLGLDHMKEAGFLIKARP